MGSFYKNHQNLSKNEAFLRVNEAQIVPCKEHGRSMVEMLGVLAIIGVLSVGAISGYRYAMNKYRANQTVNELNLLSHQVAIAMMSKNGVTELKLGEPYDTNKKLTSSGYNIAFGCGESSDETPCQNQNKFHFEVKQVAEGVCKELVQISEHLQFIKSRTETCDTGNNAFNLVFELPDSFENNTINELPQIAKQLTCYEHGVRAYGRCDCQSGYSGESCEIKDETCSGNGNFNNGSCTCDTEHYGKNCEFSISKCQEHGIFEDWNGYGYCRCEIGDTGSDMSDTYAGGDCSETETTFCHGKGRWVQSSYSGHCSCDTGYYGRNCETNVNPCINGSWDAHYSICFCSNGYEGDFCDQPKGTICKHGSWRSGQGEVMCTCDAGWKGTNCNIINENCIDVIDDGNGGFCSSCKPGYAGIICDENMPDWCSSGKIWYNTSRSSGGCRSL